MGEWSGETGDWLNYGERKLGEQAAQLYDLVGWGYDHVAKVKLVAGSVEIWLRSQKLSWSHHREVASLSDAEQRRWLERAVEGKWSKRRLVEELRNAGLRGAPEPAPEPVPDHMGWGYGHIANVKSVARNVKFTVRTVNLSWSHHCYVNLTDSKGL